MAVQYALPNSLPEWELPEVPVPESPEHDEVADRLRSVLVAWLGRTGRPGAIRRNLAIRWDPENTRVGVDPDVCWVSAIPPGWDDGSIGSLRLWQDGHRVPPLAIEIVSRYHPYKDYGRVQDKYAVVGVEELWVFDPRKFGARARGGPVLLQVWSRTPSGVLVQRHYADTKAHSPLLDAWLFPEAKGHLRLAADSDGQHSWPSLHEQERARADAERARADAERARADAERARADELAAEVARLKSELDSRA
jgi:Uma2 family endonuclease